MNTSWNITYITYTVDTASQAVHSTPIALDHTMSQGRHIGSSLAYHAALSGLTGSVVAFRGLTGPANIICRPSVPILSLYLDVAMISIIVTITYV